MLNIRNYKLLFTISLLFIHINIAAIETYESTKFTGKNKFQRIGEIEAYLTQFTTDFPKKIEERLTKLREDITKLENKKSETLNNSFVTTDVLKTQIDLVKMQLNQSHLESVEKLNNEITKAKADTTMQIDTLRSVLETRILVLEKYIANLGKIPIKN